MPLADGSGRVVLVDDLFTNPRLRWLAAVRAVDRAPRPGRGNVGLRQDDIRGRLARDLGVPHLDSTPALTSAPPSSPPLPPPPPPLPSPPPLLSPRRLRRTDRWLGTAARL